MASTIQSDLLIQTILLRFFCFEPSTDVYIQPRIFFRLVECRCLWFLRSLFESLTRASSPFPCPSLIHGRWRFSFSMTNLLKGGERGGESSSHEWASLMANCCCCLFFFLLAAKETWSIGMRTLDLRANTNCEACINPQDHGALADRVRLTKLRPNVKRLLLRTVNC